MADQFSPELAQRKAVADALLDLIQHQSWDAYAKTLDQIEWNYVERLISGPKDETEYLRGVIQGLRVARNQPKRLIGEFFPGQ